MKIDPSAALALARRAQQETEDVEQIDIPGDSPEQERAERRAAWKRFHELREKAYGHHVLVAKNGDRRKDREVMSFGINDDRGLRMVLIPYTEIEMRTRRDNRSHHVQFVNPSRVKRVEGGYGQSI